MQDKVDATTTYAIAVTGGFVAVTLPLMITIMQLIIATLTICILVLRLRHEWRKRK